MTERFDGVSGPPEAFVTGASRGIGAETARALGRRGWAVALGYRDKEKRVNRVAEEINAMEGPEGPVAETFKADITSPQERRELVEDLDDWIESLDALILNAAGGLEKDMDEDYAMRINHDAQVGLARRLSPYITPNGSIIFVTSHWAHLHGQVELPPFEYEPIASSKHAGEESLRNLMPQLTDREIRLVIVTGGLVTGTHVGDYAVRNYPEFTDQQRQIGNVIPVEEMGERIAAVAANPDLPSGHVEVVGAELDVLREQSGISG